MTRENASGGRIVFDGILTMRTADAVRATLLAAITPDAQADPDIDAGGLSIDCAGAGEIDLTFIQLLIAARISAHQANRTLWLATPPDGALLDTLTRGGFRAIHDDGEDGDPAFWFERSRE
jgi:hypothetical protein